MSDWNPRYVVYAKSQGRSPEAQLVWDEGEYPGGKMAGFMAWVSSSWNNWARETGETQDFDNAWSPRQHKAFDRWLLG